MAQVKGSNPPPVKVVPYRPVRRLVISVLVTVLVVTAVVGSYYWGHHLGGTRYAAVSAERDQLRKTLRQVSAEAESLRQQVANLTLGSVVDSKAGEEIRSQTVQLKAQIARLEEDIAFYRSLMAPDDNNRGLTIGSLNVISTGVPRYYEYKLVVQQLATNHQLLDGHLTFDVVGWQDGDSVTLPLYQLSRQVDDEQIALRFRYFQNIEGELVLPEGFEPERIELAARSRGNTSDEKSFGWLVQSP